MVNIRENTENKILHSFKQKNPAKINSTQGKTIKTLRTYIISGMSKTLRIINIIWELR